MDCSLNAAWRVMAPYVTIRFECTLLRTRYNNASNAINNSRASRRVFQCSHMPYALHMHVVFLVRCETRCESGPREWRPIANARALACMCFVEKFSVKNNNTMVFAAYTRAMTGALRHFDIHHKHTIALSDGGGPTQASTQCQPRTLSLSVTPKASPCGGILEYTCVQCCACVSVGCPAAAVSAQSRMLSLFT